MSILSDILNDVGAEMGRLGTQGSAELAAALFGGNAYVQYGAGQSPVETTRAEEAPAMEQQAIEEQSHGREM